MSFVINHYSRRFLYCKVNKNTAEVGGLFKRSTSIDAVNVSVNEIDPRSLKAIEKLGEGQFGEILLCRIDVDNFSSSLGLGAHHHMRPVVVKSLRQDCDESSKYVVNF